MVQKLKVSNKEAIQLIVYGRVLVNGKKGTLTQAVLPEDVVSFNNHILKQPTAFIYLAYHKPRGIESTLNKAIENNLIQALKICQRVFPVGRLDKDSEGLMLLTNNGEIVNRIIHANSHQEKEYLVTVDKSLTPLVMEQLNSGVMIMGQLTRPATVTQVDEKTFRIVLTQGLNRQIRRMCYKLGYTVNRLIRTRIISIELGNLAPGEWRHLSAPELKALVKKTTKI